MGFSNSLMHKAIREQMRTGRVPDLNKMKREQQEAERRGMLSCRWNKDRQGRLYYGIYMEDMYGKELPIHKFYNVSSSIQSMIRDKVMRYSRMHRQVLSQLSRNQSTALVQKVQSDLDNLVLGNER